MSNKILIIGACGQIGTELTVALRNKYGQTAVIAADLNPSSSAQQLAPYVQLNVLDTDALRKVVIEEQVTQIYLLAAMLSAKAEQNIMNAWNLNMQSLLSVLELAKELKLDKVFWPSSIAVFGTESPSTLCPQFTITEPITIYGISKCTGELWCKYYFEKFGVDVRSIRYPGLISYTAAPGGGTTDYAVDIFHQAIQNKRYTCYLNADTSLPMMYLQDAVRATLELMEAPKEQLSIRTSYNLAALTFSPAQLAEEIAAWIPEFQISYEPDQRQAIADSWPESVDDSFAVKDWGWKAEFNLPLMVKDMLENLEMQLNSNNENINNHII